MLIWRGFGILSPIIFVAIYFMLYWVCSLFGEPKLGRGWYIFFGAVVAGIVTNLFGRIFNTRPTAGQAATPSQVFYSHSFFFVPMQYSGFVLSILLIFFGVNNTMNHKRQNNFLKQGTAGRDLRLENKRRQLDSMIVYPKIGDYYLLRAIKKDTIHGQERNLDTKIPLKIVGYDETKIEFLCPFIPSFSKERNVKNYDLSNITDAFKGSTIGFNAFIEKEVLLSAKVKKDGTINMVRLPDLLKDGSINLTDILRIHQVPFFIKSKMIWNKDKVDIFLKNIGTATTVKNVIFSGNVIKWNPIPMKGMDLQNPKLIKRNDRLRLQSYQIKNKEIQKITIICDDEQHQFNLYREEDGMRIEKVRIPSKNIMK